MLFTGISVESSLSIWNNLRYPQDKVCCVGIVKFMYSTNLSVYITFYKSGKATNVLLQSGKLINFIRIWNDCKEARINEVLTM